MSKKIFFSSVLLTGLLAGSAFASPQKVNIYTYDSFTSDWGAAPALTKAFIQEYPQCELNFIGLGDSGAMFNRLRLEGKKTKADIVLGLDDSMLTEAKATHLFQPHKQNLSQISLPYTWQDTTFLPYDFGQFAFIYNQQKLKTPPTSLKQLVERQDLKVIYQDPRTSSVGRGLLIWLNQVYENQASQAWQQLAKHTVTVGKGWSETYGAFLKGESDLVLSYSSSPLYHILNEKNEDYAAAQFSEGGVLQVEVAAKITSNNACADQFMHFLIQPKAQQIISQTNVMLPVINQSIEPHYDELRAQQLKSKTIDTRQISSQQVKQWLQVWQQSLSQ